MSFARTLLITSLIITPASHAATVALSEALMQCSPQFFKTLYQQRSALKKVSPVETDNKGNAWVPVADKESHVTWFSQPVRDGALTLTGYYEQQFDLGKMGKYYFWGVMMEEPLEKIKGTFPTASWQKSDNGYITNPQIKVDASSAWKPNVAAALGIAPVEGSAEKLVMLETSNGKSRLSCSLQGSIDEALLHQERPDIAAGNK